MDKQEFLEKVFELAFGDDAINKGYTYEEVLEKLEEYSENAYYLELIDDLADRIKEYTK